jgi:hypothetical protein
MDNISIFDFIIMIIDQSIVKIILYFQKYQYIVIPQVSNPGPNVWPNDVELNEWITYSSDVLCVSGVHEINRLCLMILLLEQNDNVVLAHIVLSDLNLSILIIFPFTHLTSKTLC